MKIKYSLLIAVFAVWAMACGDSGTSTASRSQNISPTPLHRSDDLPSYSDSQAADASFLHTGFPTELPADNTAATVDTLEGVVASYQPGVSFVLDGSDSGEDGENDRLIFLDADTLYSAGDAAALADGMRIKVTLDPAIGYQLEAASISFVNSEPDLFVGPLQPVKPAMTGEVAALTPARGRLLTLQTGITGDIADTSASGVYWHADGRYFYARVSALTQFTDGAGRFAFAYEKDGSLYIAREAGTITLAKEYPVLGTVISDRQDNLYVVWGQDNFSTDTAVPTMFISKYTADGIPIATTAFTGVTGVDDGYNARFPFDLGNCDAEIHDNTLVVTLSKEMYNGHQMKEVLVVDIQTMRPLVGERDVPLLISHSFDQRVTYYHKANTFAFVDQGDAFVRGFDVQLYDFEWNCALGSSWDCAPDPRREHLPFTFYLPQNANYNMYLVNQTWAQLGGIAETSRGLALVGASAMSISEQAPDENRQLFIQVFDPTVHELSAQAFVTTGERSGATSLDIYDNANGPLTYVTDHGVAWLTDYVDDLSVYVPQVVATDDDRLIVLWESHEKESGIFLDSWYMLLDASGAVLKPAESLQRARLNAFEDPVYFAGSVYWASAAGGRVTRHQLVID